MSHDTARVPATVVPEIPAGEAVLALALHWGERLVALEHVAPGQRPRGVAGAVLPQVHWAGEAAVVRLPEGGERLVSAETPVREPLGRGLTLSARLRRREAAIAAGEPTREQLFAFRVLAFATLGLLAAIAMLVVTPTLEDDDASLFDGPRPGPTARFEQPVPQPEKKVFDAAVAPVDPGRVGAKAHAAPRTARPGQRDARAEASALLEAIMGGLPRASPPPASGAPSTTPWSGWRGLRWGRPPTG